MASIYIASSLHNLTRVKEFVNIFNEHGIDISYDWTTHGQIADQNDLCRYGEAELMGVINADLLFFLQPGRNGAHVEFGVMLALIRLGYDKTIVLLEEDPVEQKTFYHLACINKFHNKQDAIDFVLKRLKNEYHK